MAYIWKTDANMEPQTH